MAGSRHRSRLKLATQSINTTLAADQRSTAQHSTAQHSGNIFSNILLE
jgi:hypothetical protein